MKFHLSIRWIIVWRLNLRHTLLLASIVAGLSGASASAQTDTDLWQKVLEATRYADSVRAGVKRDCREESPRAQAPQFRQLCPKLASIPDRYIESAALPYVKKHVTEEVAKRAIEFWSSALGQSLARKIVAEIATGVLDQLTPEDIALLDIANRTSYGRALLAFNSDRAASVAVIEDMRNYQPARD